MSTDFSNLAEAFGGRWCDCIEKVIDQLTPERLAVYCMEKKYREFHKPTQDETGVRYGYYLRTVTELRTINEEEIRQDVNVVAGFGKFFHRDYETLEWTLKAIQKIADFEGRTAQKVAEDVVKCDEKKAPPVHETSRAAPEAPFPATGRKIRQTSSGMRRL